MQGVSGFSGEMGLFCGSASQFSEKSVVFREFFRRIRNKISKWSFIPKLDFILTCFSEKTSKKAFYSEIFGI